MGTVSQSGKRWTAVDGVSGRRRSGSAEPAVATSKESLSAVRRDGTVHRSIGGHAGAGIRPRAHARPHAEDALGDGADRRFAESGRRLDTDADVDPTRAAAGRPSETRGVVRRHLGVRLHRDDQKGMTAAAGRLRSIRNERCWRRIMKLLTLLTAVGGALMVCADVAATREDYSDAVRAAIEAQFAYQPPSPPGRQPAGLTAAERRELMAWLDEADGKGLVPVVLTDARELRMLDLLYKATRRPAASKLLSVLGGVRAIRAKLDKCSEFLKEHEANGLFLDVGANSDGKLRASALQSTFIDANPADIGGFGTVLTVFDSSGIPVTDASGKASNLQVTLLTEAPPRQGANNAGEPPRAVGVFTTFMNDGTPCQARRVARVLPPPKSITTTAPNNSQNRKTVVCLNRGAPEQGWPAACDFGPFPQAKFDDGWAVVVPLAGTIVMPYPLALKEGKIDAILTV